MHLFHSSGTPEGFNVAERQWKFSKSRTNNNQLDNQI